MPTLEWDGVSRDTGLVPQGQVLEHSEVKATGRLLKTQFDGSIHQELLLRAHMCYMVPKD